MQKALCICELVPTIDLETKLSLIIHQREINKTTNTGLLAARCLVNSEVRVRGKYDGKNPYEGLYDNDATHLYLYPTEGAVPLTKQFVASLPKPIQLIVPDGTWSQAKKVFRRIPNNHRLTPVTITSAHPSEYKLRHIPVKYQDGLSTLEAVANAIEVLESAEAREQLLYPFRVMVSRTLLSRGKLKAYEVFGGITN